MSRSKLASAPKVVLYINGQPYANVITLRFSSETPRRPVHGIDSGEPYELVVGSTRTTGSMQVYRLIGDGGAEGAGIVAQFRNLPREKYFSMALVERYSDITLFKADRCSLSGQSWDIPSRGFITGTLQFEALDWSNEAPQS